MRKHYAAKTWRVTACGYDMTVRTNIKVTDDPSAVDCGRCPKSTDFPKVGQPDMPARNAYDTPAVDKITDLQERALFLGFDGQAAARLADCFDNYDMVSDPCVKHPNHSASRDKWGYATTECAACEVIRLSAEQGYYVGIWAKITADRHAEYVRIMTRDIATTDAAGECVCGLLMQFGAENLPAGGRVCLADGSVFVPEGTDATQAVLDLSADIIRAKTAPVAEAAPVGRRAPVADEGTCPCGRRILWGDCAAGHVAAKTFPVADGDAKWVEGMAGDPSVEIIDGQPYGASSGLPIFRNVADSTPGFMARMREAEAALAASRPRVDALTPSPYLSHVGHSKNLAGIHRGNLYCLDCEVPVGVRPDSVEPVDKAEPAADGSELAELLGARIITDPAETMAMNRAKQVRLATKFLAAYGKWVEMGQQDGSRQAMAYGWGGDFAVSVGRERPVTPHALLVIKGVAEDIVSAG